MDRVQILLEERQKAFLILDAKRNGTNVSEAIRQLVDERIAQYREAELARAAEELAGLYSNHGELTAFTALEGESWHE